MEWFLPIKTISESNSSEHWSKKHKRHKTQKLCIRLFFNQQNLKIIPPCSIKLVRVSPRILDDDNLVSAFKWIRDAIAEQIHPGLAPGRADDDEKITWIYKQEKGKLQGIKIILEDYDFSSCKSA